MKKTVLSVIVAFIGINSFIACSSSQKEVDTATTGEATIAVDESFKSVIDSEVYTFNSIYQYATLTAHYLPESKAVAELINDSARLIIVARDTLQPGEERPFEKTNVRLWPEEIAFFKQAKIQPRVVKIAKDGIALILHPSNRDTLINEEQLEALLKGKISKWSDIGGGNNAEIIIVFDHSGSSTARYFRERFSIDGFGKNSFAAKTNEEVIEYVRNNKNAIGVIGVNWISDGDDPKALGFSKSIKVMAVAKGNTTTRGEYYQPYQAYLALNQYPLSREIYMISREARTGLGTGFMSFVAGDKGQRILLKSGIMPANQPIRILQFSN
jgi:phosphate transport system substrate-binding protein